MKQIVECVPNFSDGRHPAIYNGIADQIRAVRGAHILNVSANPHHNRTVITFVGSITAVEEAAFQAIAYAAKHINLDHHTGDHPRIGATDVCPFNPVKGVTTKDCVTIARRLGKRVGEELGIAVYLFGDAATTSKRAKLNNIRKGGYELWKTEVGKKTKRKPDFGPDTPATWGATAIGARPFLISYNIYLNSDSKAVADKIARTVRHSNGGLRYVQASGFLADGQAQVSMYLTNFNRTPIHHVQEMVRREAARYGLVITKAELIGMSPQKALMDAANWYLQLDDIEESQILEYQLAEVTSVSDEAYIPHQFLDQVANDSPTPAGGAVAAVAGALCAALVQMVASVTLGRSDYEHMTDTVEAIRQQANQLRQQLTAAIEEDAAAFNAFLAARRNSTVPDEAKKKGMDTAVIGICEVPLRIARLSFEAAKLAQKMTQIGNVHAVTDGAAGVLMARSAIQTVGLTMKVNVTQLADQSLVQSWLKDIASLEKEVSKMATAVMKTAAERGGF